MFQLFWKLLQNSITINLGNKIIAKYYAISYLFYFLISVDYGAHPQHWLLFDRLIQQIILQSDSQEDHDLTVMDINVQDLVQQYVLIIILQYFCAFLC